MGCPLGFWEGQRDGTKFSECRYPNAQDDVSVVLMPGLEVAPGYCDVDLIDFKVISILSSGRARLRVMPIGFIT